MSRVVPKAILGWIDVGGVRTPIFLCDLDPAKLRKATGPAAKNTFYYDAVTVDPRYEQLVLRRSTLSALQRHDDGGVVAGAEIGEHRAAWARSAIGLEAST